MDVHGRHKGFLSLGARIIDGDFDAVPFLAKRKDIDALFVYVRPFFFFGRDVGDRVGPAAEEAGDRYPAEIFGQARIDSKALERRADAEEIFREGAIDPARGAGDPAHRGLAFAVFRFGAHHHVREGVGLHPVLGIRRVVKTDLAIIRVQGIGPLEQGVRDHLEGDAMEIDRPVLDEAFLEIGSPPDMGVALFHRGGALHVAIRAGAAFLDLVHRPFSGFLIPDAGEDREGLGVQEDAF